MYRSPLLLFYFLRNRLAMFSRHLITACGFTAVIGIMFCLPTHGSGLYPDPDKQSDLCCLSGKLASNLFLTGWKQCYL